MARRRSVTSKAELIARLHRGLRPKLRVGQVHDLALAHVGNLDTIAKGEADEVILWQWVGGLLTWSKAAELLELGVAEIEPQLRLANDVIERFGRTGRVVFTGPEYQLAKTGVIVMDMLAERIDQATATAAADWGENKVNELAAKARACVTAT
jgi:hypothetical protein